MNVFSTRRETAIRTELRTLLQQVTSHPIFHQSYTALQSSAYSLTIFM